MTPFLICGQHILVLLFVLQHCKSSVLMFFALQHSCALNFLFLGGGVFLCRAIIGLVGVTTVLVNRPLASVSLHFLLVMMTNDNTNEEWCQRTSKTHLKNVKLYDRWLTEIYIVKRNANGIFKEIQFMILQNQQLSSYSFKLS